MSSVVAFAGGDLNLPTRGIFVAPIGPRVEGDRYPIDLVGAGVAFVG